MKIFGREFFARAGSKSLPLPQPYRNSSYFADVDAVFSTGQNFNEIVRQGLYSNAAVQGCITAYSMTMPEAPWCVKINGEKNETHPLARLLSQPNKSMSAARLRSFIASYVAIGGNAYLVKVRNKAGIPIGVYPYHDGQITPIAGQYEFIEMYRYSVQGYVRDIPPEDVVHIYSHFIDPLKPHKGMSPILAAARNVDIYAAMEQAIYNTLKNDLLPRGIVTYPANVSLGTAEVNRVKEQLQQSHSGSNTGRTIVFSDGAKYERISYSLEELQADNIFSKAEVSICQAFRVHPLVAMTYAGLMNSTYSNMEEAFKQFTTLTRMPLWNDWADALTAGFASDYPGAVVEFETTNVQALKPKAAEVEAATKDQYVANIITLNEARQRLGLEPAATGGETYAFERVPQIATPTVNVAPKAADHDAAAVKITKDYLGRNISDVLDAHCKAVDTRNEKHGKAIADAWSLAIGKLAKSYTGEQEINLERWTKAALEGTLQARTALVKDSILYSLELVGLSSPSGTKDAADDLQEYVDALDAGVVESADKIADSIGTIKSEVQQIIKDHANTTPKELADLLREKFATLTESRAAAIGQTTATAASGASQTKTWEQANRKIPDERNKIKRVWITRNDGHVRDSHAALNRQPEDANGGWMLGSAHVRWPADSSAAAKDAVHCRCVVMPIRQGDL